MTQRELEWNNDGHRVIILVDKDVVTMTLEYCPHGGREAGSCWNKEANGCLVKHFIDLYGFEINKGIAPAALFTEISWAFMEGFDLYTSIAYIMPNEDESFKTWVEDQMSDIDMTGLEE